MNNGKTVALGRSCDQLIIVLRISDVTMANGRAFSLSRRVFVLSLHCLVRRDSTWSWSLFGLMCRRARYCCVVFATRIIMIRWLSRGNQTNNVGLQGCGDQLFVCTIMVRSQRLSLLNQMQNLLLIIGVDIVCMSHTLNNIRGKQIQKKQQIMKTYIDHRKISLSAVGQWNRMAAAKDTARSISRRLTIANILLPLQ